ncbi:MAG: hypothetical protein ACI84D_000132 [Thalassolituus oleivorans]
MVRCVGIQGGLFVRIVTSNTYNVAYVTFNLKPELNLPNKVETTLPEEPVVVQADPDALEQVVLNLLSNAFKYSGASRYVAVGVGRNGSTASLTIEDRGVGIAAEDLPQLFEPYFRAKQESGPRVAGTGLGLSIVKHTVDAHGGTIVVDSQLLVGDGTFDYELFGCDRSSNTVYYTRKLDDNRSLFAVQLKADGSPGAPAFVRELPSDADPIVATNGSIAYTLNRRPDRVGVVASIDPEGGRLLNFEMEDPDPTAWQFMDNGYLARIDWERGLTIIQAPNGTRTRLEFTEGWKATPVSSYGDFLVLSGNADGHRTAPGWSIPLRERS